VAEAGVTQGWGTPIYQTEFPETGNPNPTWWSRYDGPGHNGNGTRDPERIQVANGVMTLTGLANGSTGGMAHELGQQYGRWEVRMRAYSTGPSGSQYHPVLIVWPDSDDWPEDGEYDFLESDIGDTQAGAWIHYPHNPGAVQQVGPNSKTVSGGIAEWHNYAIDWQPTGITCYIDGAYWFGPLSGGANSSRRNIQAMPSGHLTIQLDGFHGDSGYRPAKMDIEWVKIYDNATSGGGSNAITGAGGIAAPAFLPPAPFVGNRFRMYLTNTAAEAEPTPHTTWEQASGYVKRKLDLVRAGANTSVAIAETSVTANYDVLLGQWVSRPMTSAGTLKGPYTIVTSISESDLAADFQRAGTVRVVSGDGSTVRGVFTSWYQSAELTTTGQGYATVNSAGPDVACQVGDRLVVELGYKSTNAVATSYTGTLRYGGTAGDVEHLDTTGLTTNSPHIAFPDPAVERLFRGQIVAAVSVGSSEAFGTAVVTQPPVLDLGPSGIASAQAVGAHTVTALAYVLQPEQFGGETFGTLSVNQSIVVPTGIPSDESVTSPTRVIRTGDLFPAGIASTEAIGAVALLYIQGINVEGISTLEAFGETNVEDPNRIIRPAGISSAEAFGVFGGASRLRTFSIDSAEAFGYKRLAVKCGRWRLVQPTRIERHRIGGPWNVLYITNVIGLTVYGTGQILRTQENPRADDLTAAQYVWQGGRDNITEDQAIRDLWVANGYSVEMSF
jgi:hypothetical protein